MSKVDFLELETDSPSFRSISIYIVDDTGIEPVTPSMSRKCATAALIVRLYCSRDFMKLCTCELWRWRRDLNPCSGICSPEPRLSATPPNLLRSNTRHSSGRRGSNPRPEPWQGSALPTALRPHL